MRFTLSCGLIACLAATQLGCAHRRYTDLPDKPRVAHDFNSLLRHSTRVGVTVDKHHRSFNLSWVEAIGGEGDDKPPLLLVHGLMTSAYSWRYVMSRLSKKYRVIAVDLPGAGRSDAPADLSESPHVLAEVLEAFVNQLGYQKIYVVGNSMGGYVSLWWSLAHPDRFERLLIMHSPGFPEARLYALHTFMFLPFLSKPIFAILTNNHEQFALENVHYRDESLKSREETREYARWTSSADRREVFRRNLFETMDPWTMRDLPAAVSRARTQDRLVPIRLLWSTWDPLVPPNNGNRYKSLLPEADLVWLSNTSHFMHVDTPEPVAEEILRFGEISVAPN